MTIAIFSDVHANLPALEAVMADMDKRKPDSVYCLGDLVGYAPWPNEVVRMIRDRSIPCLAGNYDYGVGRNADDCGCAYKTDDDRVRGAVSISLTNRWIGNDERAYLRSLPHHLRLEFQGLDGLFRMMMVHGSPRRINEYLYEDRDEKSMVRILESAGADMLLFGHTHMPFHRIMRVESASGKSRYLHAINTGSVGKPKDNDPLACYVLLHLMEDLSANNPSCVRVEFVRVPYDLERAATAIEASDLPLEFADMLRNGG